MEPGFYWAIYQDSNEMRYRVIAKLYGESPFMRITVWLHEINVVQDGISPRSILQWGKRIPDFEMKE